MDRASSKVYDFQKLIQPTNQSQADLLFSLFAVSSFSEDTLQTLPQSFEYEDWMLHRSGVVRISSLWNSPLIAVPAQP